MFKVIVLVFIFFCVHCLCINSTNKSRTTKSIKHKKPVIWGPGLTPAKIVLPIRYFFINAIESIDGKRVKSTIPHLYEIKLKGTSQYGACRYAINQLHRNDGSTIVRYRIVDTCRNAEIHIKYKDEHIGESPYIIHGDILPDSCICPKEMNQWMIDNECRTFEQQIYDDLKPFSAINFTQIRTKLIQKFNQPSSISLCNYVIRNNEIFRKCYGQYTGFKMFMDAILTSIVRKVQLPDMEFFMNLGDWPLVKKGGQSRTTGPYPVFSWCGSDDSFDIVLPTYDITESTLENMGKVTLDILSVQHVQKLWKEKIDKAFWRGRDSRRERLQLIDIARDHPEIFNVSLTNFFFFRDEEAKYGPKAAIIPFMDFFDYKYQINVDGSVAAYRMPYLLGGNSIVLKQKSPFYEHFYKKLIPFHHYIPFERDLSDLVTKIHWAQNNEDDVLQIIENANKFVNKNLLPKEIFCYHVLLLQKWSENLVSAIRIHPDMEKVPVSFTPCDCDLINSTFMKDEL